MPDTVCRCCRFGVPGERDGESARSICRSGDLARGAALRLSARCASAGESAAPDDGIAIAGARSGDLARDGDSERTMFSSTVRARPRAGDAGVSPPNVEFESGRRQHRRSRHQLGRRS
jgi:hypothetical protein